MDIDLTPQPGPTRHRPTITVIVTSLNREELLPIALRSLQLQGFTDFDCVVVDDASTDASASVGQAFADVDSRFRVVVHPERLGSSAARNTGIALAYGDLICFLDDDDFLLQDSLASRYASVNGAPPEVAGAFCGWINTNPDVGLEVFSANHTHKVRGPVTFSSLRGGAPFILTSPLIRRSVLELVGGFREDMPLGEDAELWFRICRRGFRFVDANVVGVAYRRSPRSKVLSNPGVQLEAIQSVFDAADQPAPGVGPGPMPISESLGSIAAVADRSPQIYRYLAMIALTDVDRAISTGRRLLPAPVRAEIEPAGLARQLTSHAVARTSTVRPEELFDATTSIHRLVDGLLPGYETAWATDYGADGAWNACASRAEELAPTPRVLNASAADVGGAVILIPEALYHLDELGPLYRELRRRGQLAFFMLSPKTVPAARAAIGRYTDEVFAYDLDVAGRASAIVSLNDWGPVKELFELASEAGVPTYAKVEGVQDFNDDDTGRQRGAYRTASTILGQGQNDVDALPDKRVEIVGSSRLERIWLSPAVDPTDFVLVNLNFTFNVLTEHRSAWIRSVRSAVRESGLPAGISAHPAERTQSVGLPFVEKSFRHEITRSGVLVSRFSTVPFEAMARGVPFIYHNPHGERVPTFKQPQGAFPITVDAHALASELKLLTARPPDRSEYATFFLAQVDVDTNRPSEVRTADVILGDTAS